jgi:hypothetical protein
MPFPTQPSRLRATHPASRLGRGAGYYPRGRFPMFDPDNLFIGLLAFLVLVSIASPFLPRPRN